MSDFNYIGFRFKFRRCEDQKAKASQEAVQDLKVFFEKKHEDPALPDSCPEHIAVLCADLDINQNSREEGIHSDVSKMA